MKREIEKITITVHTVYWTTAVVQRPDFGAKYYAPVTPSSLRRCQRAQLRLAGIAPEK